MKKLSIATFILIIVIVPAFAQEKAQLLFTAGGEIRSSVPVSGAMITALRKDAAFPHVFPEGGVAEGDIVISLLPVPRADAQVYIVVGRRGLPGVAKDLVIFWIIRKVGAEFEAINNFGGGELEVKDSQTGGYYDLELRSTSSGGKYVNFLKYDPTTRRYESASEWFKPDNPPTK